MSDTPVSETKTNKIRKIKYDGREFPDPGAEFSNEDILSNLKSVFPELANARISVTDQSDGTHEVLFEKVAGTKG